MIEDDFRRDRRRPREHESLSEWLMRLHRYYGYKKSAIARKIGMAEPNYGRIVRGQAAPRKWRLKQMAEAYELPASWFERYSDQVGRQLVPLREVVRERKLVRQFIGVKVDAATEKWFTKQLDNLAEVAEHWQLYWDKKHGVRPPAEPPDAPRDAIDDIKWESDQGEAT